MQKSKIITSKIPGEFVSPTKDQNKFRSNEIDEMERQIKNVKYPILPLAPAIDINLKIQTFHSQIVKKQLLKLTKQLKCNSYRKVRGDGNCFFRALAFFHLDSLASTKMEDCFCYIDDIPLTWCLPQSIPKIFKSFYHTQFLREVLKRNWEPKYKKHLKQCNGNYKRALTMLFNQNNYLDFIVVLYYRSLCYKAFVGEIEQYKFFMRDQQTQKKEILFYSCSSEGIILNVCSRFFKLQLRIIQIRSDEICSHILENPQKTENLTLIYSEKHYDLLENNKDLKAEELDLIGDDCEETYSQVSQETEVGECIECGIKKQILKDLSLCQRCYNTSKNNMGSYQQKERFVEGRCTQCLYKREVSQSFGICRKCIKDQAQFEERKKQQQIQNRDKVKCKDCGQLKKEADPCSRCQRKKREEERQQKYGRCLNCGVDAYVYTQLGICEKCKKTQQTYGDMMMKTAKQAKCEKCDKKYLRGEDHRCINTRKSCRNCGFSALVNEDGLCSSCERREEKKSKLKQAEEEDNKRKEEEDKRRKREEQQRQKQLNFKKDKAFNSPKKNEKYEVKKQSPSKKNPQQLYRIKCKKCERQLQSVKYSQDYICFPCETAQKSKISTEFSNCIRCAQRCVANQITNNICNKCIQKDKLFDSKYKKPMTLINQKYVSICQKCGKEGELFATQKSSLKMCVDCMRNITKQSSIKLKVDPKKCQKCGSVIDLQSSTVICNSIYCKNCAKQPTKIQQTKQIQCQNCGVLSKENQMFQFLYKLTGGYKKVCFTCKNKIQKKMVEIRMQQKLAQQKLAQTSYQGSKQSQDFNEKMAKSSISDKQDDSILCKHCKLIKIKRKENRQVCNVCMSKGKY